MMARDEPETITAYIHGQVDHVAASTVVLQTADVRALLEHAERLEALLGPSLWPMAGPSDRPTWAA